jgi:hypothetical protein
MLMLASARYSDSSIGAGVILNWVEVYPNQLCAVRNQNQDDLLVRTRELSDKSLASMWTALSLVGNMPFQKW